SQPAPAGRRQAGAGRSGPGQGVDPDHRAGCGLPVVGTLQPRLQGRHRPDADRVPPRHHGKYRLILADSGIGQPISATFRRLPPSARSFRCRSLRLLPRLKEGRPMNDLLRTYFDAWPGVWAMDTARYVVAATLMAAIVAAFWQSGLARRKLQNRSATGGDIRREILASLRSALIFSLMGTVVIVGVRQGWVTLYTDFAAAGPLYLVLSLAFMLVAHDAYFYWMHRAMHHRRLFRLFHRHHHLSQTPTP